MTNYKIDAINELRKFLWNELVEAEVFDAEEYYSDNLSSTIVPILPVQQQPEMNQFLSGKKHIIYDKVRMHYDDIWLICNEQVLFTIYATDISEINEIRNIMIDLFRRMDESAGDVNKSFTTINPFKFHSIVLAEISPTAPSEELNGFLSTDIVLDVKYSRSTDQNGRFV